MNGLQPSKAVLRYLPSAPCVFYHQDIRVACCILLKRIIVHISSQPLSKLMFSFWPLLIALIAAYGSIYLVDWWSLTPSSNSWTLIWIISLVGGLYLMAGGVEMATRWGDTISTTNIAQIPDYAHSPKAMLAGLLLVFWPYTVMAAGALPSLAALWCLRRRS